MASNDQQMWAMHKAGMPFERIAKKFGLTVNQVKIRVAAVETLAQTDVKLGIDGMVEHFNFTCLRYQMLGEDLKKLGAHLCNPVSGGELLNEIKGTPTETVINLMQKFIILHPWKEEEGIPISPSHADN
jgi:hypothetical protein